MTKWANRISIGQSTNFKNCTKKDILENRGITLLKRMMKTEIRFGVASAMWKNMVIIMAIILLKNMVKNRLRIVCCAISLIGRIDMRLKELREEMGIPQRAVAEKVGCSPLVYSRYEREEREPDIDMLCRLADYFNVSIDYLVERQ